MIFSSNGYNMERISREQILARLEDRVIIMDGAMGTLLQKQDMCVHSPELDISESPCLLNLTDPESVAQVHRSYIRSGSELIETNTFNSAAVSHQGGASVYGINFVGAQTAAKVASEEGLGFMLSDADGSSWKEEWGPRRAIVAGSIAATSRNSAEYEKLAEGLVDGGADVLLLESAYDLANAESALGAIAGCGLPVMVSVSIDKLGRILSGENFRTVFARLAQFGLFSIGFNCSLGAQAMIPFVAELAEFAEDCPISICPSAGIPSTDGHYPEGPEFWASCIGKMSPAFNFIGGCCGTTPEYIKALNDSLRRFGELQNRF